MSLFFGFEEADLQRVGRFKKTWWFAVDCSECSGFRRSELFDWIDGQLGCCIQFESLIDGKLSGCVL